MSDDYTNLILIKSRMLRGYPSSTPELINTLDKYIDLEAAKIAREDPTNPDNYPRVKSHIVFYKKNTATQQTLSVFCEEHNKIEHFE